MRDAWSRRVWVTSLTYALRLRATHGSLDFREIPANLFARSMPRESPYISLRRWCNISQSHVAHIGRYNCRYVFAREWKVIRDSFFFFCCESDEKSALCQISMFRDRVIFFRFLTFADFLILWRYTFASEKEGTQMWNSDKDQYD